MICHLKERFTQMSGSYGNEGNHKQQPKVYPNGSNVNSFLMGRNTMMIQPYNCNSYKAQRLNKDLI